MWELSKSITDEDQLRSLALVGLSLSATTVDACLTNEKKVGKAAYELLKEWLVSKTDMKEAYDEMCRALVKVGLKMYISKILDNPDIK